MCGNGGYQFTQITLNPSVGWFLPGDFNGDGRKDFISGNTTYLNLGGRQFQQVNNHLPTSVMGFAVAGEFNGDGIDDIVFNFSGGALVAIYYGDGKGDFYGATLPDPGGASV